MKKVFLTLLFLAAFCYVPSTAAQTSATGRIEVGLAAARPVSCVTAGDVYISADTPYEYVCGPAGTWNTVPFLELGNTFAGQNVFSNLNTFNANVILHGPDPFRDVMSYGASGSTQTTTLGLDFTNGSTTITSSSALDFRNGQSVRIIGPGVVPSLSVPTGLAITPKGTTGSTIYTYQIGCVDSKWGGTAAGSSASTVTGNATLTYGHFNQLGWSADAGCNYYAVWETVPVAQFRAITPNLFWYDYGQAAMQVPSTIPSTPPVSAFKGYYYGTITAGGGTTILTMDTASGATTGAGATLEHDDSAAIQATVDAATTPVTGFSLGTQDRIYFPPGNYNVTRPIIPSLNNPFMTFYGAGSGQTSTIFSHVVGMDVFIINRNNDDLTWQDIKFSMAGSATSIRFTQSASQAGRVHIIRTAATGSSSFPTTFLASDINVLGVTMDHVNIGTDVHVRFGEPGFPVQLDSFHVLDGSEFFVGTATTQPGTFQFVTNATSGLVHFQDSLIEGPMPVGSNFPLFWMGGGNGGVLFKVVEFAPEAQGASFGPTFAAVPGMAKGIGTMTFEQSPSGSYGTGGTFDWSGGTGNAPLIILRESNLSASGANQNWKTALDSNGGIVCENSTLSPAQTLLGSNGKMRTGSCIGIAQFTDSSNLIYGRSVAGADQDILGLDDSNGNTLFHIGVAGALGGTATVSALPTAAAGNKGQVRTVSDSTAVATEGQTCVGSSTNTALAFSNGVVWKCF